jgi:hypothetical protein
VIYVNKHGLSRPIPAGVARQVRQECGFGCVVCGMALVQYDHFDPPFAEAFAHRAEGIALLCGHCHDKRSRGWLTAAQVAAARAAPRTFKLGSSHEVFNLEVAGPFSIKIGTTTYQITSGMKLADVNGESALIVEPPEESAAPYQLSAKFRDSRGRIVAEIDRNVWLARPDTWDIECLGTRLIIRSAPGKIWLQICLRPGVGIDIERLDTLFGQWAQYGVRIEGEKTILYQPDGPDIMWTSGGRISTDGHGILTIFFVRS